MKRTITIIFTLSLIINITNAQPADWVEAKYKGKPIIQMMLNGQNTWVLLDTGSDFTVLDADRKDHFGFVAIQTQDASLKVPGFGSTGNQLMPVSAAKIDFEGVRLRGPIYAYDISAVAKSIQQRTGKRIAGIIGTRMMSAYGFVIDMRKGTASIPVKKKKNKLLKQQDQEPLVVTTTFNHSH